MSIYFFAIDCPEMLTPEVLFSIMSNEKATTGQSTEQEAAPALPMKLDVYVRPIESKGEAPANAYTIRLLFLSYITTVIIETRTITAFAAMVPAQVIVMVPKIGDAALNMVWNNTHINTRPFPDIL